MEANRFCTHCGRAIAAGMRFCTGCGAEWVELPSTGSQEQAPAGVQPQVYAPPVPLPAKKPFFSGWRLYASIGVGIIVGLMVIGALFGEEDEKPAGPTSAQGQVTPAAATAAPATAATAAATASAPQAVAVLKSTQVTPAPGNRTVGSAPLGSSNSTAAEQLRRSMQSGGVNMTGVSVDVARITRTEESLALVTLNETAARNMPADPGAVLKPILGSPAIQAANITQLAFVVSLRDRRGTFTLTAMMPLATARQMANNALSQEDVKKQVKYEMKRS